MTGHEELHDKPMESPYAEAVDQRNKTIATKFGVEAAQKTLSELGVYADLFVENGLVSAAERARLTEASRTIEARVSGKFNDVSSVAPGIFVAGILDHRLFDRLRENLTLYGIEYELDVDENSEIEQTYRLCLPQGVFEYSLDAPDYSNGAGSQDFLWIYMSGEVNKFGGIDSSTIGGRLGLTGGYLSKPYRTNAYGRIGRIEGADGILWQNPGCNSDGTIKNKVQASAA